MVNAVKLGDPLAVNLRKQTAVLLAQIPDGSPHANLLQNTASRTDLLQTLSHLLSLPAYTTAVAIAFRPLLFDLCARWLHDEENTLDRFQALCLLLEIHTEIYPILSTFLRHPNRREGPLAYVTNVKSIEELDVHTLHRQLCAYYRILQANRDLPKRLGWPISHLSRLVYAPHPDPGVRLLAIQCFALQMGITEGKRTEMEKQVIGTVEEVDCPIAYSTNLDGSVVNIDGWIMSVMEVNRIASVRNAILQPQDYSAREQDETHEPIHPAELSPFIANVHGVLMLRSSPSVTPRTTTTTFVETVSAVHALKALALHHSLRVPTLLTSAPSSGKSLLLSQLASMLHPNAHSQIITIHLADTSLDPRSLFGSYASSPTRSGTFEWKEGVLVKAMHEGKWVVFEDIDRASMEVLGAIKPLVESLGLDKYVGGRAMLDIPNRGTVVAEDSFAIYATRSVSPSRTGTFAAPTFYGAHKFHEMVVASPSADDLRLIVETKFGKLAGAAAEGLIRLWEAVKALGSAASLRDVGLRELDKLCTRVDNVTPPSQVSMDVDLAGQPLILPTVFPNLALREDIYLEARDVFFGVGATTASARAHLEAVTAVVAEHLGLSPERRDWLLHRRTPEFEVEKDMNGRTTAVRVGSTRLRARTPKTQIVNPTLRLFAMHRPALQLLSRIAAAVSLGEPVLLTGETGTGKTSAVTHLAALLNRPLVALNLSNQTESSDLVGGFKPVDARAPGAELQARFLELFSGTFSKKKNEKFEGAVRRAVQEGKWKRAVGLWRESTKLAREKIRAKVSWDAGPEGVRDGETPRKRRKMEQDRLGFSEAAWEIFERDVQTFEVQHVQGKSKFAFAFVEGILVKALRSGDWILLDEVNLATPETLECISSLLHGPTASITLTEQGSLEPVPRHSDFRLFACMNPATDVGKRDLPPNIRARFTEIDVPPPDADKETLLSIVDQYIRGCAVGDRGAIMDVAEFYLAVKQLADERKIADGSNHRPHFSMRTLARALTFAADMASTFSLRRALWEGCLMTFTMVLDEPSAAAVISLAQRHLLAGVRNPKSLLSREPTTPQAIEKYLKVGPFYLERGPLPENPAEDYIMTLSVEKKLIDLARIISAKRFPILIEGPTSAGKTSSIEYLAKRTGHRFVRINNHEHTDIQEYLGSYVSDVVTGKLVFRDGLLVRALRNGDWIVLDELNLAPTDVLEALNRLLDDNRELVIPETQEVVRPHPHFILFATQNPPGLYAGRKVFSRAFRNRFLEVHFEDVPQAELETILCQRCRIAPSYGQRIVSVFCELQRRRQSSRVFESKHGFATLRDLFRWAQRDALDYQQLAENGYMLLAERARRDDDKAAVKEVIESIMKVHIDDSTMYDLLGNRKDIEDFLGCSIPSTASLVWTSAMQRLFILVARALRFNEPVLLVGETGSGKTSVCQMYADIVSKAMRTLNCHQNTETADLIGGLRPIRNRTALESETIRQASLTLRGLGMINPGDDRQSLIATIDHIMKADSGQVKGAQLAMLREIRASLERLSAMFEWRDGPLVESMRLGEVFLLDEISLADDSVLERINSVLEPERTVVLAERGGDAADIPLVKADDGFKLVATMNPGGDYGKKELSPALRNRFTEIWVPPLTDRRDFEAIVNSLWQDASLQTHTAPILDFAEWLSVRAADRSIASIRDILAWVDFTNVVHRSSQGTIPPSEIFHHAAQMTYLDGLGSLPQFVSYSREALLKLASDASAKIHELVPIPGGTLDCAVSSDPATEVQLGFFSIPRGPRECYPHKFSLQAPTARDNVMRVVRACQLSKPILLEGSPGVGKTSLVTALANLCGYRLCRINLSDQTDIVDLFGSDLPVEGGEAGQFAWKDAEFLRALQEGHWVLLDEMNLAPQAILEGLNAVLDHRGAVYIPELGRSFNRHPAFRIFAAQNPLNQGGGRKGLPKSFVNRFTKVYVEELTPADILTICRHMYPSRSEESLRAMINFTTRLNEDVTIRRAFGREGAPWEFNLRDIIRWATLLEHAGPRSHPADFLAPLFIARFRSGSDRDQARALFKIFFPEHPLPSAPRVTVAASTLQVGHSVLGREGQSRGRRAGRVLQARHTDLETIGTSVENGWLTILVGHRGCGKTSTVRLMASLCGQTLHEIQINNASDASDILGSFEEVDPRQHDLDLLRRVVSFLDELSTSSPESVARVSEQYDLLFRVVSTDAPAAALTTPALEAIPHVLDNLGPLPEPWCRQRDNLQLELDLRTAHTGRPGRLEWVDGPLVRALRQGDWVILDGANLCNPSVLDRLNSLCESGGVLALNERGQVGGSVQTIEPHPRFRLFMSVDPQHGELSRAMRNRGVELAFVDALSPEDRKRVTDHLRLPSGFATQAQEAKTTSVEFEIARRGYPPLPLLSPSNVDADDWPAGRLVGLDSPSAFTAQLAPSIRRSAQYVEDPFRRALSYFVGNSIVPLYAPHLSRFLHALAASSRAPHLSTVSRVTRVVSESPVSRAILQKKSEIIKGVSAFADDVLMLPIDTFGPSTTTESAQADEDTVYHLLSVLRLLVSRQLDREDRTVSSEDDSVQVPVVTRELSDTRRMHALRAAQALLEEIETTVESLLTSLGAEGITQLTCSGAIAMTETISYSRHLRGVVSHAPLDYSALQVFVKRIVQSSGGEAPVFANVHSRARLLEGIVSLSSGQLLVEIWTSLAFMEPPAASSEQAARIAVAGSLIPPVPRSVLGVDAPDRPLRSASQVLNVMSLWTLPQVRSSTEEQELARLTETIVLTGEAQGKHHYDRSGRVRRSDSVAIGQELAILSSLRPLQDPVSLRVFLEYGCCYLPLSRLVPYQQLIWAYDTKKAILPLIARAHKQWLEGLWNLSALDGLLSGPSVLLTPIDLCETIADCSFKGRPLDELRTSELIVLRRLNNMCMPSFNSELSRTDQLSDLLLQAASTVILCSMSSSSRQKIMEDPASISSPPSASTIAALLDRSGAPVADSFQQHVLPLVVELTSTRAPRHGMKQMALGRCWIALARALLEAYVPDAPVDPVAMLRCAVEYWNEQKAIIGHQLDLHVQHELRTSGQGNSSSIQYLRQLLADAERSSPRHDELPSPARDNVSRLHSFWTEVTQLMTQVLSPSKIDALVADLEVQAMHASTRETVTQESLGAFGQRLHVIYPDFVDMSGPIQLALLYVRLGLRLVLDGAKSVQPDYTAEAAAAAAALFPSVRSSERLQRIASPRASSVAPSLTILAGIALDVALGRDVHDFRQSLQELFEQLFGLWSIDRARSDQAEREAQSLYRHPNESVTEAELEEQDFLSLFPQFEDAIEVGPPSSVATAHPKQSTLFGAAEIVQVGTFFQGMFGGNRPARNVSAVLPTFMALRQATITTLLDQGIQSLPESLDRDSRAFQLSQLYTAISALSDSPPTKDTGYNFYVDANVSENRRAVAVLHSLRDRLISLIEEWPDQMVLEHLRTRCEATLRLDLCSPIAGVLSALEQLVLQIEDWEMYANRQNSLKAYQHELTSLIVDWRRLELSSWQGILHAQTRSFTEGVFDWWFRLYEAIIRGVASSIMEETNGQEHAVLRYLDGLVPLLDDFIVAGPIGQFETRLAMLFSFGRYIVCLTRDRPVEEKRMFTRVHTILESTRLYYAQFLPRVNAILSTRQAELEKDVRDFIKLASWKDINVHALRQSAQRSHKQLYKVVRKFREVLRQPARGCFTVVAVEATEHAPPPTNQVTPRKAGNVRIPSLPPADDLPSHLVNLDRTYANFEDIVLGRLVNAVGSASTAFVIELSEEVISTSNALAKSAPPSDMQSTQREKFYKSLLSRKRRAWSDLLKELKRVGLAANVKPDVLAQQRSLRWLREQPLLASPALCEQAIKRADGYMHRLWGSLPALRSLLSDHHQDVSTRELHRGVTLLESGFSMAVESRRRVDRMTAPYERLNRLVSRLRMVVSSDIARVRTVPRGEVAGLKDRMCKLVHALEETGHHLVQHNGLNVGVTVAPETLDEVQSLLAATREHAARLSEVSLNVDLSSVVILLADESQAIQAGSRHILTVVDALMRWSDGGAVVRSFARPVREWLEEYAPPSPSAPNAANAPDQTAALIDALLLSIQSMLPLRSPEGQPDSAPDSFIRTDNRLLLQLSTSLNLDSILRHMETVMDGLTCCTAEDARSQVERVLPFLTTYLEAAQYLLVHLSEWTGALLKLDYVICSVMLTLAKEGFCKPPETKESGEGAEGAEVQADGTGLGGGVGNENVSKEIQDESQVEGLQGDDGGADEPVERAEEGNAIEMGEDVGGEMQDVEEGECEDDEEGQEQESDAEPEEQVGDLDASDPSAIDEKLWGDETGPRDSEQDGGMSKEDHSQRKQESEMVAKQGDDEKRDQKESSQPDQDGVPPEAQAEESAEDTPDEPAENAEPEIGGDGAPLDEHIQEANTLDLPDDMDLDAGKGQQEEGLDDDISMDEGDPQDETAMSVEDEPAPATPPPDDAHPDQSHADDLCQTVADSAQEEDASMDESGEGNLARPDLRGGDGQDAGQTQAASAADESQVDAGMPADARSGQQSGRAQEMGDASQNTSTEQDREHSASDAVAEETHTRGNRDDSTPTTQSQQGSAPSALEGQQPRNPLRSLSDALREISRHMSEILESSGRPDPSQAHPEAPTQVEYLQPDDTADHSQALGPAMQEEVAKLDELTFAAEDTEMQNSVLAAEEAPLVDSQDAQPPSSLQPEVATQNRRDGVESALTAAEVSSPMIAEHTSVVPANDASAVQSLDEASRDVEIKLREWQSDGQPSLRAGDIWRLYESLTHDLSYALCEQLRLILAPTQATRLKGDYRTGKRLNMKKIIPYIASEFTKDKIWLRRTRPSQREYQVLIALDDSRSMAESHSVHLAYETLALVSRAMSRLEVGDVAIAKFGEDVEVLHGFDSGPFTDQAGTRIVDAFRFDQKATQMLSLIETSLQLLEQARERSSMSSASAADLWQLEIIISDGICQDHEKLRTALRKAAEQRVMVVFIVLDSLHARSSADGGSASQTQSSILQMNQVAYRNVDGRMDLHVERYLDTFPFEYYVVLRDVEALPDVLTGTLKQFFERIAEN